jgi:hypothetical protein
VARRVRSEMCWPFWSPPTDFLGLSQMNLQPPEKRTWRRFALPASVLLNIFLIALIGGHFLRHRADDVGPGAVSLPRILVNAQASLSASDAAAFGAIMRRDAPHFLESARKLADARTQLEREVTALRTNGSGNGWTSRPNKPSADDNPLTGTQKVGNSSYPRMER